MGATRSRVSVARLAVCSLVVVIVGGAGLLIYRALPVPNANSVTTTAVVVSSLACTDGPGGTAVDVLPSGPLAGDTVRGTLDACGYQEGQQLAVQYPAGNPTQLSLAGTDAVDLGTGDRLLPIGLLIAALLAVGAGVAVWLDSRRGNRRGAHSSNRSGKLAGALRGGDAKVHNTPGQQAVAGPAPIQQAQPGDDWPDLASLGFDDDNWPAELPDPAEPAQTGRKAAAVDLVFPSASSLADSLHDELFTHRNVYS